LLIKFKCNNFFAQDITEMRNVWYFRKAKHIDDDLKKLTTSSL